MLKIYEPDSQEAGVYRMFMEFNVRNASAATSLCTYSSATSGIFATDSTTAWTSIYLLWKGASAIDLWAFAPCLCIYHATNNPLGFVSHWTPTSNSCVSMLYAAQDDNSWTAMPTTNINYIADISGPALSNSQFNFNSITDTLTGTQLSKSAGSQVFCKTGVTRSEWLDLLYKALALYGSAGQSSKHIAGGDLVDRAN